MKAEMLNRIETEKGEVIKVVLTVPVGNTEVFALKKGEMYEISLSKPLLPEHDLSYTEMYAEGLRLLNEAQGGLCDNPQGRLELEPKGEKGDGKCATCLEWSEGMLGKGYCGVNDRATNIYDICEGWRDRNEKDKAGQTDEKEDGSDGLREPVASEEQGDEGVPERESSGGGSD